MGECKYCGRPAGLMKSQHAECRDKHDTAIKRIPQAFTKWVESEYPAADFHRDTAKFAKSHFVSDDELRALTLSAFGTAIDKALEDHLLTTEEEDKLASLLKEFGLTLNDLAPSAGHKLIKGAILKDLDEGKVPERINLDGSSSEPGARQKITGSFRMPHSLLPAARRRTRAGHMASLSA